MKEYTIIPEFHYSKAFPYAAILYQIIAIGLGIFGYFVALAGFIFALLFQLCSVYYTGLFLCNRYYRMNITPGVITVWSIFNRSKKYQAETLRWKIHRMPWFNNYFILLYSSGRAPIGMIKPHWKNALKILHFPHFGPLTGAELNYLKFLKDAGLLAQATRGRFYALR